MPPAQLLTLGMPVDLNRMQAVDFERLPGEFENTTLNEAKRTPRKLNQLNHVTVQVALAGATLGLRWRGDKSKREPLYLRRARRAKY